MKIQFPANETATQILERAQAIVRYHNSLLHEVRGGGSFETVDALGLISLNQLICAMMQAAINKGHGTPSPRPLQKDGTG